MLELAEIEPQTTAERIPRHARDGRPKIFPASEAGKKNPKGEFYTRTTTFIDALDDKSNLADWKLRLLLEGVHRRPELLEEYASLLDPLDTEKRKVKGIAERAIETAGAGAKADLGSALHRVTEDIDNGLEPGFVPPEYENDVEAYVRTTHDIEMMSVEEFCVLDAFKVAGTFDRAVRLDGELAEQVGVEPGSVLIADVKTGRVDFSRGKFGMQFAGYSRMERYDPDTYARSPLEFDGSAVHQGKALMIHLPAGEGRCSLIPIDIDRGWQDLLLAAQVREYRKFWNRKESEFTTIRSVEL